MVEQISRNARTIMFSMLLACVYTWLTIATTTDPLLLTNSISSPLPIIRTEIPIAGFFWVAPLILLSFYLYFHIYLQRLWETLADLPAVFPDGSRLDKRAYPWLLNGLVTSHFKRLQTFRPQFSRLQTGLSVLLGWWTVPITLFALWIRYLPRHDWLGTTLHVMLSITAIGAGILFYRAARATLRRETKPSLSWKQYLVDARGFRRGAFVLVMSVILFGFSFGAIHGIPYNTDHAADISAIDLRLWVPRLMEGLGNSSFVDFIEENLSTKPANWVEKQGNQSNLGLIKGARLKNANLDYARARSAFLLKGDLRKASLFGADLGNADLCLANLQGANLNYAILTGAQLAGVKLKGTSLKDVTLANYDFYSANFKGISLKDADFSQAKLNKTKMRGISGKVDLAGADLQQANIGYSKLAQANFREANLNRTSLVEVDLRNANLVRANLSGVSFGNWVKIDGANLEGADLRGAHIKNARGLTCEQLQVAITDKETKLPKYLGECGQ